MNRQNSPSDNQYMVQLPEQCTNQELEQLHADLYQQLCLDLKSRTVILDGRGVQAIDVLGLQLLVWFQARAREKALPFQILTSKTIISNARMFGLHDYIQGSTLDDFETGVV